MEPISKTAVEKKGKPPARQVGYGERSTEGKLSATVLQGPFEHEIRNAAVRLSHECDAGSIAIKVSTKLVDSTTINWHRRSDVILRIISSLTTTLVSVNFPESSVPSLVRKLVEIATKLQLQIDAAESSG